MLRLEKDGSSALCIKSEKPAYDIELDKSHHRGYNKVK